MADTRRKRVNEANVANFGKIMKYTFVTKVLQNLNHINCIFNNKHLRKMPMP